MALPRPELGWHQKLFTTGHRFSPFGAAGSIACISDWSKDEARTEPSILVLRFRRRNSKPMRTSRCLETTLLQIERPTIEHDGS
jgi:hypothetical protein